MMKRTIIFTLLNFLILAQACTHSDFSGQANKGHTDEQNPPQGGSKMESEPPPGPETSSPDTGTITSTDASAFQPKVCDATSIFFARAGQKCPANYAAYTADDGSSALLGCCPLPAGDILLSQEPVARSSNCQADEVATGVVSGRTLYCSKIDTTKYKLSSPAKTCYNGSGASGGDGSSKCGGPSATLKALVAKFGSDACMGFPYGSLIVRNSGKDCGDISAAVLTKVDGTPLQMFAP